MANESSSERIKQSLINKTANTWKQHIPPLTIDTFISLVLLSLHFPNAFSRASFAKQKQKQDRYNNNPTRHKYGHMTPARFPSDGVVSGDVSGRQFTLNSRLMWHNAEPVRWRRLAQKWVLLLEAVRQGLVTINSVDSDHADMQNKYMPDRNNSKWSISTLCYRDYSPNHQISEPRSESKGVWTKSNNKNHTTQFR